MASRTLLTVVQLNDRRACFALHQEEFWLGGQEVDRPSGGSARIDRYKFVLRALLLVAVYSLLTLAAMAQEPGGKAGELQKLTAPASEELSTSAPAKVEVSSVAHDEEIVKRLQGILHATNWFTDPQVRVAEGVVFLSGQVESEEIKKWAGNLETPRTSSPWSTGWR